MKKIALVFCLALTVLAASARGLLITTKGGVAAYFPITATERPVMIFVNSQVWVEGRHYQFGDIAEFRLVDADPTGVRLPIVAERAGSAIVLNTLATVVVSDLDGRLVEVPVSQADGQADGRQVVDVSRLPKGAYVVKAGKSSFKFVKK